jgi:ketosteroid isomerase-like protein
MAGPLGEGFQRARCEHDHVAIRAGCGGVRLGPPLQTLGKDTYSKNYKQLLSQYEGPVEVEYRDLHITAAEDVGFANGLERFSGTIKGQKSTMWARFTSGFRKTNGVWLDVHDHVSVPADFESGKLCST